MEVRQIEEERKKVAKALNERIEFHDESRKAALEKFQVICDFLRPQNNNLYEDQL